uniref:CCHC-type domain-containing protein n=1 Tax=Tanacetum cinerariifolium TaxID=118510 RepID=A0A6L2MBA3_TANCI|nr:hypothetical protein [Tanacetum cinerariifolium]
MDSIIPLRQKNTLAEYMILSSVDNRPPMLDKDLYDSSRMELYMQSREHGRMIIESVENDPLIWPTVEENMVTRTKKYVELFAAKKIQERKCKLYDAFDKFTHIKEESLHKYYLRFTKLINDMNIYNKKMKQFQVNTKFLYNLPPEWRDDPIACLGKAMAFLTAVASSSYFGTGYKSNATSSEGNNASGQARVVKCYNCQGEGHMARQCTQPKRPRNAAWYKDKAMLAEAQEAGQILDEEKLAFLADPGVLDGQAMPAIIPNNAAFQTEDLDTYDFDCDDVSNAKAVLMANISNYGFDIILEVHHSETYLNDMENQMHMLTKPQAFYDNIHKQALGYQNSFYLKKAQRIKPTLYDGIVISNKHVAMPMIDDEETLILEEVSR